MLIDRQPKPFLTGCSQGEIGRAAAIDHQAVAHGGGGAVEINHHLAGSAPLRPKACDQLPSSLHLPGISGVGLALQEIGPKTAVEIAIDVAPAALQCPRISDGCPHAQASPLQRFKVWPPLLQQPGGVAFIAVGTADNKNRRHHGGRAA